MDAVNLKWHRQFATRRSDRLAVLIAVAATSISFALFLWWFVGVWMILPFAGLEILCVTAAFWWLELAADDYDAVAITESHVNVVRSRRNKSQRMVFNRGWLSTELKQDPTGGLRGVRLLQSGRSVELLEFLPVSQQRQALTELRAALLAR